MAYWGYPRYVTVAEKRAKAAQKLKQLRKKMPAIQPVIIAGRALAHTWWGKSWNLNLERYADYSNRIGRGRSYVRHGAVLDLQISPAQVKSLVQGSRSKPYSVAIQIKGIPKKIWQNMKAACAGKLDSLPELLDGSFPKDLNDIFMAQGRGLFPSPKEIQFDCSCPDWAYMCKHVAATLYGIGARLDDDPSLFFKLRKVKIDDLVQQAVKVQSYKLLKRAEKASAPKIAEADLSQMFSIDMEETVEFDLKKPPSKKAAAKKVSRNAAKRTKIKVTKRKPRAKTLPKKKQSPTVSPKSELEKTAKQTKAKAVKRKSAPKAVLKKKTARMPSKKTTKQVEAKKKPPVLTATEQILKVIKRSRKGITVVTIKQKTGLDDKKIRNTIFQAFRNGTIERVSRGIYRGAKRRS